MVVYKHNEQRYGNRIAYSFHNSCLRSKAPYSAIAMCASPVGVCRACLAADVRMHAVQDSQLLQMYETLTDTKLDPELGIPQAICFVCFSRLRRCRAFRDSARRSERILRDLIHRGIEVTNSTVNLKLQESCLSISTTQHLSIDDLDNDHTPITVKQEPIVVKEEPVVGIQEPVIVNQEPVVVKEEPVDIREKLKVPLIVYEDNSTAEEEISVKIETLEDEEWFESEQYAFLEGKGSRCEDRSENIIKDENLEYNNSYDTYEENDRSVDANSRFIKSCDHTGTDYKSHASPNATVKAENEDPNSADTALYICDVCDKRFATKHKLKRHLHTHRAKRFACNTCSRKFSQRRHLRRHESRRCCMLACDQCGRTFIHKANLIVHMRSHTGERPFSCHVCGKTFSFEASLTPHMRYFHTGEKPYRCATCHKRFAENGTLKRHMMVHSKRKPYACARCGGAFSEAGSLRRHAREAHGEQSYACDLCDRTFVRSYTLRRHKLTHSSTKPHACDICRKTFSEAYDLKRHLIVHLDIVHVKNDLFLKL